VLHEKFVLASFHDKSSCNTHAIKEAEKLLVVICEGKDFFRAVAQQIHLRIQEFLRAS